MSDIKPEQIIAGIKQMLLKAEAITAKNANAIEEVLNTRVLQDIIDYGKQANDVPEEESGLHLNIVSNRTYKCNKCEVRVKPIDNLVGTLEGLCCTEKVSHRISGICGGSFELE